MKYNRYQKHFFSLREAAATGITYTQHTAQYSISLDAGLQSSATALKIYFIIIYIKDIKL